MNQFEWNEEIDLKKILIASDQSNDMCIFVHFVYKYKITSWVNVIAWNEYDLSDLWRVRVDSSGSNGWNGKLFVKFQWN